MKKKYFFIALLVGVGVIALLGSYFVNPSGVKAQSQPSWCMPGSGTGGISGSNPGNGQADVCPSFSGSVSATTTSASSGGTSNTIVVSGSYFGGMNTNLATCVVGADYLMGIPIPYGGATEDFKWSTDDGLSGTVTYTPTQAGGGGGCAPIDNGLDSNGTFYYGSTGITSEGGVPPAGGTVGASGGSTSPYSAGAAIRPEKGNYTFSFVDPTPGSHTLTVSYSNAVFPGHDITEDFDYGAGANYHGYQADLVSDNLPSSVAPSQVITTGTNGAPLSLVVKNTGVSPWVPDQSIPTSLTGQCAIQEGDYMCPAANDPAGSSCTVSFNNFSTNLKLKHVSGSFSVASSSDPVRYSRPTQNTCAISNIVSGCGATGYCAGNGNSSCSQWTCGVPQQFGGCGPGTWTNSCVNPYSYPLYGKTTTGDETVEPGATATFTLDSLTAPGTPGTDTETWQMENAGTPFLDPMPISITVGTPAPTSTPTSTPSAPGTVNVVSENAVTGGPVDASWFVFASTLPSTTYSGAMDVCGYDQTQCYGSARTYGNLPTDNDVVGIVSSTPPTNSNLVLRGVEEQRGVALKKNSDALGGLFAFSKSLLFGVANAEDTCDAIVPAGGQCDPSNLGVPYSILTSSATPPVTTANFTILWDPVAVMNVSSTSPISLDTVNNTSATATVSNIGAAGSVLDWSAATTYDANGSGWLSINGNPGQASGSVTASTTPSVVTFTVNAPSASGTYQATVTFTNNSVSPKISSSPIVIALTVGSSTTTATTTDPCPTCITSTSQPTISITPASSNITLGGSQQLTIDSTSATTCAETGDWSGSSCSSTVTVTPNTVGTFTYNASAHNINGDASAAATINVTAPVCPVGGCTPPPGSASCTSFTASPSSVTPGQKSKLSYTCTNVTSCSISSFVNGQFTGEVSGGATGSESVGPTTNTIYTLNCDNGAVNPQSVQVTVTNPGLNETNP
jgi:hypothetical protein